MKDSRLPELSSIIMLILAVMVILTIQNVELTIILLIGALMSQHQKFILEKLEKEGIKK